MKSDKIIPEGKQKNKPVNFTPVSSPEIVPEWYTQFFGTKEFTARELSDAIRKTTELVAGLRPELSTFYSRRTSVKMISNDLRRLYAMGFLKRRRVKREVKTKDTVRITGASPPEAIQ
jgi:hypothetical protein